MQARFNSSSPRSQGVRAGTMGSMEAVARGSLEVCHRRAADVCMRCMHTDPLKEMSLQVVPRCVETHLGGAGDGINVGFSIAVSIQMT